MSHRSARSPTSTGACRSRTIDTGGLASATGFFLTAADVVRYAAAPSDDDERLLTADASGWPQRAVGRSRAAPTAAHYGLGSRSTRIGERRLLGHGGGFPGPHHPHAVRSDRAPRRERARGLIDGPAQTLVAGAVRLVNLAAAGPGRSDDDLDPFCGRFANLWGVFDIVALGGHLYRLDPTLADPTSDRCRLDVVDDATLRIAQAPGYMSPGERYVFDREPDGTVSSVHGGSALTSYPYGRFLDALATHHPLRPGDPVRPPDERTPPSGTLATWDHRSGWLQVRGSRPGSTRCWTRSGSSGRGPSGTGRAAGDAWSAPSRCDRWTVHDVVRHVRDVSRIHASRLGGAPPPFPSDVAFNPRGAGSLARAIGRRDARRRRWRISLRSSPRRPKVWRAATLARATSRTVRTGRCTGRCCRPTCSGTRGCPARRAGHVGLAHGATEGRGRGRPRPTGLSCVATTCHDRPSA